MRCVVIATQIHFQFWRQTSKVSKRIRDNLCVQEIDRGRIGFDDKPYKDSAREVRKKNEKMVTSQSEKWKVLERIAHQGNKEKWRDWTRKASGYLNEITCKIIYRNFWKRGGSELEYFKRSPNRLTRIQRMFDKRAFVLSSTLFMFFIQTRSTSGL